MRHAAIVFATMFVAAPAFAQEPVGCDKFKWPIEHERTMLAAAAPANERVAQPLAHAYRAKLVPFETSKLPMQPSRAPKPGSNAGFVSVAAPPTAGTYRITLSEGAWIDVVQDNHLVKSGAFTGATGCAGIRKSVKFDLTAAPFTVEFSGAATNEISFVITPDQK